MAAGFTLELRRQVGSPARFAVRYACRNGRAVLGTRPVWSVTEASLRSNSHQDDMSVSEVLAGVFVFVGFELADNGKFELWIGGERALLELRPNGPWVAVKATLVEQRPFFSLDTDELEFDRPWKRRRRRLPRAEPVTEPGVVRSRWQRPTAMDASRVLVQRVVSEDPATHSGFFDMPGLAEPLVDQGWNDPYTSWDEREVLALPEAGLAEVTRDLDASDGGVSDLLRVVSYLREELGAERREGLRMQAELARLQAVVAALVEQ